jgi:hypothetical protein
MALCAIGSSLAEPKTHISAPGRLDDRASLSLQSGTIAEFSHSLGREQTSQARSLVLACQEGCLPPS